MAEQNRRGRSANGGRSREQMAEIGRKGGEVVSRDREHMAEIGRRGGEAVSRNREHMAEIGRRGGEASRNRQAGGTGTPAEGGRP